MTHRRLKLVVVGSGGRLGAALTRGFAADAEVVGLNRSQLDLTSPEAIRNALSGLDFDALVNCAALTNVDYCETHEEEAMEINGHAVRHIAEICTSKRARMVHIGTDYVFNGTKADGYTEADEALPISVYGASKLQGEVELAKVSGEHLTARVSWVFGPDRPSFVDQILKRAQETDALQAIGDKWSAPTYTLDLVGMIRPLLRDFPIGGVIHLANASSCTWQEYGQYALDSAAAAGLRLKGRKVAFQAMADLKAFIAKRPIHTKLATCRLEELTGRPPRPWQEAVSEYVHQYYAPKA